MDVIPLFIYLALFVLQAGRVAKQYFCISMQHLNSCALLLHLITHTGRTVVALFCTLRLSTPILVSHITLQPTFVVVVVVVFCFVYYFFPPWAQERFENIVF